MVEIEVSCRERRMRSNLALVPKPEEVQLEAPKKPKRDRGTKAVFDGVMRAYPDGLRAEGYVRLAMTISGPGDTELWFGTFNLNSGEIVWDKERDASVLTVASGYFSAVESAMPHGKRVRLSRALGRRLRREMLKKIVEAKRQELAAIEALMRR